MRDKQTPGQTCRLAAELLARDSPGTVFSVYDTSYKTDTGEPVEALAYVIDTDESWAFVALTDSEKGGASYSIYRSSNFDVFPEAPKDLINEPFRANIGVTGGCQSLPETIWDIAARYDDNPDLTQVEYDVRELTDELKANAYEYADKIIDPSDTPATITALTQYTCAAPAQWYGLTEGGRPVYIRYRGGNLRVRVGGRYGVDGETVFEENLPIQVIDIETLLQTIPEDVLQFDIDTSESYESDSPSSDTKRSNSGLDQLIGNIEEEYNPDREFVRLCRRYSSTASKFAGMYRSTLAVQKYTNSHPERNEFEDINLVDLRGRQQLMDRLHSKLEYVAEAVDDNSDYQTAVEELEKIEGVVSNTSQSVQLGTGFDTHTESMVNRSFIDIAGGQYRRLFKGIEELLERAMYYSDQRVQ